MKKIIVCKWIFFNFLFVSCSGQTNQNQQRYTKLVGGGCEGCELMYIGMPKTVSSESISDGWTEGKQKLMIIGKVYQADGITPASDVVIYYWHTNEKGLYASKLTTPKSVKEHGYLRGWVKPDKNGKYTIKTSRPANYPDEEMAAHIHLSIKEPNFNEYFADLYFNDDPKYLLHKKKYGKLDRAGTELLKVSLKSNTQLAEHNIILGLNIPNYPKKGSSGKVGKYLY